MSDLNTEQAILKVAERLFLEKGFGLTSTTEIAQEAGCSQALVHYYFRTKERLFQRVFEEKIRLFISVFFQIDREQTTFDEKLKRKIEAHFNILMQNPRLPFLVLTELTTNPKRLESMKQSIGELPASAFASLQKDLEVEIAEGRVRAMSALDLVMTIFSLNIMSFLLLPVARSIFEVSPEVQSVWMEQRKKEVVTTILNSLKP